MPETLSLILMITAVLFPVTMSKHTDGHPPVANLAHSVGPLLGSLEKGLVRPSAPNPGTYIPAAATVSAVAPLLGSLDKGPVPPSAPNPEIPMIKAPSLRRRTASLKNVSAQPPAAPNGARPSFNNKPKWLGWSH